MDRSEEKRLTEQAESVINEMIDDVIVWFCAETHRSAALGYDHWTSDGDLSDQEVVDEIGVDVFGQQPLKKFAPHLEKCMGMGRNSSRLARRRVAYTDRDAGSGEEDDGDEWSMRQSQRKMKSQRLTNGSTRLLTRTKRPKPTPVLPLFSLSSRPQHILSSRHSQGVSGGTRFGESSDRQPCDLLPGLQSFLSLSVGRRKAKLTETCGVLKDDSGEMCTNHHPCVEHTDDERKAVWMQLIDESASDLPYSQSVSIESDGHGLTVPLETELDIDVIDGYRDTQSGHSPADSSISTNWEDDCLSTINQPTPVPPVRIVSRKANRSKYSSRKRSKRR